MLCACGCGRSVTSSDPRARYAAPSHRVRACRRRRAARERRDEAIIAERALERDLGALLRELGAAPWMLVGGLAARIAAAELELMFAAAEEREPARPAPAWPPRGRECACGCGAQLVGRQRYAGPACRGRAHRARRRDAAGDVRDLARASRAGKPSALALLAHAADLGLRVRLRGARGLVALSRDEVAILAKSVTLT